MPRKTGEKIKVTGEIKTSRGNKKIAVSDTKKVKTGKVSTKAKKPSEKANNAELEAVTSAVRLSRLQTKHERIRDIQNKIKNQATWEITKLKLFRIACIGIVFYAVVSMVFSVADQIRLKKMGATNINIAESIACKGNETDFNCQQIRFKAK